ncbi:unnamed protein product [Linum tenue]|uniref:Uncharacterized protein n=1 Tax=Linum tenue TaxID=586396 RepID=A0AAV0HFE3_9ROSI|nr:unnamed protein product [Linum tenue]
METGTSESNLSLSCWDKKMCASCDRDVWVLSCFRPIEVALLSPLNHSSCRRLLLLLSSINPLPCLSALLFSTVFSCFMQVWVAEYGFIGIDELREEHGLIVGSLTTLRFHSYKVIDFQFYV